MAIGFAALLDELVGHSDWDICDTPPEGDPWFRKESGGGLKWTSEKPLSTTIPEQQRERWRALRAGVPPIEAKGERSATFSPLPDGFLAFGWRFRRAHHRLVALDRRWRVFGPEYFIPRVIPDVAQKQEDLAAWIRAELAAGRGVKPDHEGVRAICSSAVGFEVTRAMLREAARIHGAARGRGRPSHNRK